VVAGNNNMSDVLLSGAIAGSLAAFLTNGIELLAVNKQTDKDFKVSKFLMQKGSFRQMFL
jgi:broad specificity polyphosphatase/5'/3'-nucleotidase SurE